MKHSFCLAIALLCLVGCGGTTHTAALEEAAARIASGKAVLVDVRESDEWKSTGVAGPATLLSKSSFEEGSAEWKDFLARNRDKEIILMCRSGNRSGQLARVLSQQGLRTTNLGGFSSWKAAGLETRTAP